MLIALEAVMLFTPGMLKPCHGEDWWKRAAAPYRGTVLRGITENTPPSFYVSRVLAREFEKRTGIRVELELYDWESMYQKSMDHMTAGSRVYDFVYIEQDIFHSYQAKDLLLNLTRMGRDHPDLVAPDFSYDNFKKVLSYFTAPETGDVYAMPAEAFLKIYLYRKDLFSDPDIQALFESRYGYPLTPAKTLKAFRDNSDFFTAWAKARNMVLWGTSVQAHQQHPSSFYEVVETLFPMFGIYNWGINTDNWTASVAKGGRLNSDRAKEALTYWLGLLAFSPPSARTSDWNDIARSFAAGRLAQALVYGENLGWMTTNSARSKVIGKVGAALPPLYEGVMDEAKSGKGYIGYADSAAFGISGASTKQGAAFLWLQYIGLPEVQIPWTMDSFRVVHHATLEDPAVQARNASTGGYFTLLDKYGHLFGGAPPFAFHEDARKIITPFIHQAIRGRLTPSEALDRSAKEMDRFLGRPAIK